MISKQQLLNKYSPKEITDTLDEYLTDERRAKIHQVLDHRIDSIQLAIECPSNIRNALACIRSAEALGLSTVHIIQPEAEALGIRGVTQGAYTWIDVCFYNSFEDFIKMIRKNNLLLAAGCVDENNPTTISKLSVDKPICLLMGNEHRGVSEAARSAADYCFQIPMVGMSESLNLSVSSAIAMFDTLNRKRELLGGLQSDLSAQRREYFAAKYYLNSVNPRLVGSLLK